MDKNLNQLLKWSIENSDSSRAASGPSSSDPKAVREDWPAGRPLNPEALKALMGGPSDAQLMQEAMATIQSGDASLEDKLVAFDNFEQLIEVIDNANNMESLGLWTPLVGQLESEEADMRRMAAWCVGTAVQNNLKAQERMLVVGAIPKLVHLAIEDSSEPVRRKAVYALSSEIRNYQPALEEAIRSLPEDVRPRGTIDSGDMEAVDQVIERLRDMSQKKGSKTS